MKNRVLIFDRSQNLISKKIEKMEKFLFNRGLFDFSFLTASDFEDFKVLLERQRATDSTVVVICDNDKLDECVEVVNKAGDSLTLFDEQGIRLENAEENFKMKFVPFELDFEKFLVNLLPEEKCYVYSIFGKSKKFVIDRFESFSANYTIITKTPFLHTVYCSDNIDSAKLESEFGDAIYSFKDEPLSERLNTVLGEKEKKLSVVEYGTNGKLAAMLDCTGKTLKTLDDLKEYEVSSEMLESENAGRDVAYTFAKNSLMSEKTDLVLTVCDRVSSSEKTFVSVGNKETVHIYSSTFTGEKIDRVRDVCDFAIFRLLCFIKKQNAEK